MPDNGHQTPSESVLLAAKGLRMRVANKAIAEAKRKTEP